MQKRKLLFFHALFWIILFMKNEVVMLDANGLSLHFLSWEQFFFTKRFIITIGYLSICMEAFYGSYVAARKIMIQKKTLNAIFYILLLFLSIVLYRAFLEFAIFKPLLKYNNYPESNSLPWKYFLPNVVIYYWSYVVLGVGWAFFTYWQSQEKEKQEKEALDKAAQLQFLQSQINPHFLFNTINDIYALSLKKSDKTPGALMQLSGLLRYALYDTKALLISLPKELSYIEDYLELQRTGYENAFYVNTEIKGDLSSWNIPPMLLLPFVENACKHGLTSDPEQPVQIVLEADPDRLLFTVSNQIRNSYKDAEGGIGIGNIQRRLALLYPGVHKLYLGTDKNIFIIRLEIKSECSL